MAKQRSRRLCPMQSGPAPPEFGCEQEKPVGQWQSIPNQAVVGVSGNFKRHLAASGTSTPVSEFQNRPRSGYCHEHLDFCSDNPRMWSTLACNQRTGCGMQPWDPMKLEHFPAILVRPDGADFGPAREARREPCQSIVTPRDSGARRGGGPKAARPAWDCDRRAAGFVTTLARGPIGPRCVPLLSSGSPVVIRPDQSGGKVL